MIHNYLKHLAFLSLLLTVSIPMVAQAADEVVEEAVDEVADELTDYAYGEFVKAADGTVTITEYDYTTEADVEMTFVVDANTVLSNFKAFTEVGADDWLDIEYVQEGDKKLARQIMVDKAEEDEE